MIPRGKRKRVDYESSDDEYSLGKQVLPVANLPRNFDGVPMDGAQYLATVRRDSRLLPNTTRAPNPYEQNLGPNPPSVSRTTRPKLPSEEWQATVERRFKNFRKNVAQPTIRVSLPLQGKTIPDKKDRDSWWAFLAGKPKSEWNLPKKPKADKGKDRFKRGMRSFSEEHDEPGDMTEVWTIKEDGEVEPIDEANFANTSDVPPPLPGIDAEESPEPQQQPREPTPSLLQHIDSKMSLHLLMYFTHWITLHLTQANTSQLTETHARWIFALLSQVDDFISADDMSLLRNLARACLALLKHLVQERVVTGGASELQGLVLGEGTHGRMGERSCWLIISIIVGVWAQRDLWMDAEAALSDLSTQFDST